MGELFEFYPYMLNKIPIKLPSSKNDFKKVYTIAGIVESILSKKYSKELEELLNKEVEQYYALNKREVNVLRKINEKF